MPGSGELILKGFYAPFYRPLHFPREPFLTEIWKEMRSERELARGKVNHLKSNLPPISMKINDVKINNN